jgi:Ca2+-transporting ATPase
VNTQSSKRTTVQFNHLNIFQICQSKIQNPKSKIMIDWHYLETAEVSQHLGTNQVKGLNEREVRERLIQNGANELVERPPKSLWLMLWEQLTDTMILVLLAAAVVSFLLKDYKEAIAILVIVIFSTSLGFVQEYRALQSFAALKKLAAPQVRACREGHWQQLSSRELVPGDLVQLEAGNQVPADCRILESFDLRILEAAFTGESEPIDKISQSLPRHLEPVLAERYNMAYKGTIVTYGRGKGIVTETGMETELGKLAGQLQSVAPQLTPLQRRLNQLGKQLAIAVLGLVALLFAIGMWRGENFKEMLLTSVSLAVAVIPESLAAIVTIALAMGAQRMLQRRALIRQLNAVETLGSVTVICSDKTGTLTQNQMAVTILNVARQRLDLQEELRKCGTPLGASLPSDAALQECLALQPAMELLLVAIALCNDVLVADTEGTNPANFLGDPTEVALVVAANRLGLHKPQLEQSLPRFAEIPFDSERKRMTTLHRWQQADSQLSNIPPFPWREGGLGGLGKISSAAPYIAFTKGGVNSLLEVCRQVWLGDCAQPLDRRWRQQIFDMNHELAQDGHRVLGVAFRLWDESPKTLKEENLIFLGVVGMMDPPRPEVKAAIATCLQAGIRPVMITGDQVLTARHVARELGIPHSDRVLEGQELARLSLSELAGKVDSVAVYARVSPDQKLKIVEALQNRGEIVAMTGDGVNDAPALKKANIGVAMGITGTDVAKEAADIVLLDDNFATIVAAVEQGRTIFDNIRKFIKYSMTGNASSLWLMVLAPLLSMPLPLFPLQILWINLLADGLLSLALSFEPAERNTMRRPPYPPNASIFSRDVVRGIVWVGLLLGLAIVALGYHFWSEGRANWQAMVFSALTFSRMSLALTMRSQRDSIFSLGLLSNKPMLGAVGLTFLLQVAVIYTPWLQEIFATMSLSRNDLLICLVVSTAGFWAVEIEKWLRLYR